VQQSPATSMNDDLLGLASIEVIGSLHNRLRALSSLAEGVDASGSPGTAIAVR
jgi:hypothetical protein